MYVLYKITRKNNLSKMKQFFSQNAEKFGSGKVKFQNQSKYNHKARILS